MAMPMVLRARRRSRQDRARAAGRARCRPRLPRAAGGHPPRGRRADGPRRRRRARASPSRCCWPRRKPAAPSPYATSRPTPAIARSLPPVPSASPPPACVPGSLAQETGRAAVRPDPRAWWSSSTRPAASRSSSSWRRPGAEVPVAARLARSHRPPAVRRLGLRSRRHHPT